MSIIMMPDDAEWIGGTEARTYRPSEASSTAANTDGNYGPVTLRQPHVARVMRGANPAPLRAAASDASYARSGTARSRPPA